MIISNKIKIIPLPFINTINDDGSILMKKGANPCSIYALNDLDIEERQIKKNGSSCYEQKLRVKVLKTKGSEILSSFLLMPCIIEITSLDDVTLHWGDFKFPVRAMCKSRGVGSEYILQRISLTPFI